MTTLAKTVVATGASSGIGFELAKQLLSQSQQPYRLILGARDVARTRAAFDALGFDARTHSLTVLPLELADLRATRGFAAQVLRELRQQEQGKAQGDGDGAAGGGGGGRAVDYLLLNAAISKGSGPQGTAPASRAGWCETAVVNHFSQHYLVHLLREELVKSKARIVVVSSGAVRLVEDTENDLKAGSGVSSFTTYSQSKFVQLLAAHWWRRQLKDQCAVVAVSPGLIPNTGLGRDSDTKFPTNLPDAKSIPEGAQSILQAFTRDDFPADPEQIFLTSWGEWWGKDVYALSLDKALQDRWCPSKKELEEAEGLSS